MLTAPALDLAEPPHKANSKSQKHAYRELALGVCQAIDQACLSGFTHSFIEGCWSDLHTVHRNLERLPEPAFKEMIQVILSLAEVCNELRDALFLFDVEEITPVYRLMMRNKAMLRGKRILDGVLMCWPYYNTHSHG